MFSVATNINAQFSNSIQWGITILIGDDGGEKITSQTKVTWIDELLYLQMTMTATHEGYHAFTVPT